MTAAGVLGAAALSVAAAVALIGLPERPPARPPAGEAVDAETSAEERACADPSALADSNSLPPEPAPFPVDIEVAFDLTDHFGERVTEASWRCTPMLLFFGYASCESICTAALPRMGEALDILGAEDRKVAALMITVDPERDTPEAMRRNLARWHESLIGLTGSEAELAAARRRFRVDLSVVAEDPEGGPIYAHGGFIYLIGADGGLKTVIPPILGPERIAALARKYF